jgi:hypothetical protein
VKLLNVKIYLFLTAYIYYLFFCKWTTLYDDNSILDLGETVDGNGIAYEMVFCSQVLVLNYHLIFQVLTTWKIISLLILIEHK